MKTPHSLVSPVLAVLASFLVTSGAAFAINVSEGPDFGNLSAGTPHVLTLGSNTFSGTLGTPADGQDRFDVTVPAGLRITQVTKNFTAAPLLQTPNISFNLEDLSGAGAGNFVNGYPLGRGTYSALVSAGFAVSNPWTMTFTVGALPNYEVTTTGSAIVVTDVS